MTTKSITASKNALRQLFLPLCLTLATGAHGLATSVHAQEIAGPPSPTVTVAKSTITEVISRVPVSGTLVPREEVLVNPQVTGHEITDIRVDIGDTVKAGETLLTLNDKTLAAALAQAEAAVSQAEAAVNQAASQIDSTKATLVQAEAALDRAQKLRVNGNISQSTLDQNIASEASARAAFASAEDGLAVAKAQLASARSQKDQATLNLDRTKIKAPVDGIISARMAKIGAIASAAADPMFRIIENATVEMEAEVIESALGTISVNDEAELSIAGIGKIKGHVRLIAPTVDPVTRLGIVKVKLSDNPGLRSGLYAGGWIITDRHEGITVPSTAILTDATGTYLLAVEDNKIVRKQVTAGIIWQNRREIVSGLEAGETVVTRAGAFFADGDSITPKMTETDSATPKMQSGNNQ